MTTTIEKTAVETGYNQVTLTGNLGQNPETMHFENSTLTTFSIAVNRGRGKNAQTDWYKVCCWNRTARIAQEYLSKGQKVTATGSLRFDTWTDDTGEQHKTLKLHVNNPAEGLQFGYSSKSQQSAPQQSAPAPQAAAPASDSDWDEIPF